MGNIFNMKSKQNQKQDELNGIEKGNDDLLTVKLQRDYYSKFESYTDHQGNIKPGLQVEIDMNKKQPLEEVKEMPIDENEGPKEEK